MDELTQRLSTEQPVVVGGPSPSVEELRYRLEKYGNIFIKFTETRGGTDLGIRLDRDACNFGNADFYAGTGVIHVEGTLVLNDDPVRCIADINLTSLSGTGRLALIVEPEAVESV